MAIVKLRLGWPHGPHETLYVNASHPLVDEMREYRSIPLLDEMDPEYLDGGHFWIQEYVVGRVVGFEMADSGMLTFGSDGIVFEAEDVPLHLKRGIGKVRADLDRDTLRAGTDNPEAYTFFGVIPVGSTIKYDWDSIPAFMGVDIWDEDAGAYVPEDVVERVFDSVGLETVPTFEKEVPARSFNPRTYEIPQSAWAGEQAAGVVLRKKRGEPARLIAGWFEEAHPASASLDGREETVEEWVENHVDSESVDRLVPDDPRALEEWPVEELASIVASELARREYETLISVVEDHPSRFESAVIERVRTILLAGTE